MGGCDRAQIADHDLGIVCCALGAMRTRRLNRSVFTQKYLHQQRGTQPQRLKLKRYKGHHLPTTLALALEFVKRASGICSDKLPWAKHAFTNVG